MSLQSDFALVQSAYKDLLWLRLLAGYRDSLAERPEKTTAITSSTDWLGIQSAAQQVEDLDILYMEISSVVAEDKKGKKH